MNTKWQSLFEKQKPSCIGMIHLAALPATSSNSLSVREITEIALAEADIYQQANVDAIILENMHDTPYLNRIVGPEIIASFTAVATAIRMHFNKPIGIQVLAGANKAALAIALAANLDFIRAEGFVFGHLADEGWMNADAGPLLRYRQQIGAQHIGIFTDIKKKHSSHALSNDINLLETAKAAEFFKSDGLIITGQSTGHPAAPSELLNLKQNCNLPILIGSGVSLDNMENYQNADALIIGSSFKETGHWAAKLSLTRVKEFMAKIELINN